MSSVDFGRYRRLVQALWDPEPKHDDAPGLCLWCLGKKYPPYSLLNRVDDSTRMEQKILNNSNSAISHQHNTIDNSLTTTLVGTEHKSAEGEDRGWPSDFLNDCESRAWFTYRSDFPAIKKSSEASMTLSVRLRCLGDPGGFTSDTGWGCMIRSGQTVLANALAILRLGRSWRRGIRQETEQELLSLFADDARAPFSIHRFVEHGASACGKYPGEWFGPSATARCIQALSHENDNTGLRVYINGDGADVYEDSLLGLASSSDGGFIPTLILVGIRLGIDRVTPAYWDALKASLQLPQSVGIAGGRPSSSHYFFGTQGDQLFYLDPHVTRPALPYRPDPPILTEEEIDSCHTRKLRRLALKDMDPSMLIAFLIKDAEDWRSWRDLMAKTIGKPVVHVADKDPSFDGKGVERCSAVDDVETFDDEDVNEDEDMIQRLRN